MILDQDLPLLTVAMPDARYPLLVPVLDLHGRSPPAICVGTGINRIRQYMTDRPTGGHFPLNGRSAISMHHAGQRDPFLLHPKQYLSHGLQLRELVEDKSDCIPDLTIGILLNPIILSLQMADRYRTKQLSTPSLLSSSGKRPLPEDRQFHLAHSSLHAEHHSIVGHTRIVHLLLVDNECSNHSAEL